jgi:hypothetical protein
LAAAPPSLTPITVKPLATTALLPPPVPLPRTTLMAAPAVPAAIAPVQASALPQALPAPAGLQTALPGSAAYKGLIPVLQQVTQQMLATQASAQGVAATLGIAQGKLVDFAKAGIRGLAPMQGQLDAIAAAFKRGAISAEVAQKGTAAVMAQATAQADKQAAGAGKTQMILGAAYAYLSSKLLGYIRAGMEGTAQAQQLSFWTSQLNREIAHIFAPLIDSVVTKMQGLVMWFRNLTGEQQKTVRTIALIATGFTGVATLLPAIVGGVRMLGAALMGLAANPIGAVLMIVGLLASVVMGTDAGRKGLAKIGKALEPVMNALGRIGEALTPAFELAATQIVDVLVPAIELMAEHMKAVANVLQAVPAPMMRWLTRGSLGQLQDIWHMVTTGTLPGSQTAGAAANRAQLGNRNLGPESFEQTYLRIQQASNVHDMAQSTREQQLAATLTGNELLRTINRGLEGGVQGGGMAA